MRSFSIKKKSLTVLHDLLNFKLNCNLCKLPPWISFYCYIISHQVFIDNKNFISMKLCNSYQIFILCAGDLGQTYDSNITLSHYELNPIKGQAMLFMGDLSYADNHPFHNNVKWDTWGRFVERSAAYQPWIWTTGNHEIDFAPEIVSSCRKIQNLYSLFCHY